MKINHNMSAVITNHQLLNNENDLSVSMEKLSSGLKINHAKDDAAGMAISTKMRAQIKGLDQASRNASDGGSILQAADGALNEVTNMIQRMRELSVQAANGTNTDDDKDAIQMEIVSLRKEIDRISTDTEFNTKKLFNGNLDTRVYADHVSRIAVSDSVRVGEYKFTIDQASTQAVYNDPAGAVTGSTYVDDDGNMAVDLTEIPEEAEGVVVINGREIEIEAGDTAMDVYEKLRIGAEYGECSIAPLEQVGGAYVVKEGEYAFGDALQITSDFYGKDSQVRISCDNEKLAEFLGIPTDNLDTMPTGTDAEVTLDTDSAFGEYCTYAVEGNKITVTNRGGFEISFMADAGYEDNINPISLNVTNIGTLTLQIGANEHQTMEVRIPKVNTETLYIDDMDVTTINGADRAIEQLDYALSMVGDTRSKIGAYQNRLDHAVASLDQVGEDMTAALSRIEDVDMAEEMTEYTKGNVLSQAATSVLAQANEIPQQVLQLLQ